MKAGIGGIVLALFGLWMLAGAVKSYRRFGASRDWPAVPGVIKQSEVSRFTGQVSRHALFVTYTYEVQGQSREGSRVALYTLARKDEVEPLAERFAAGVEVPVYVEPGKGKREAVLVPGPPAEKPFSGIILAALALLLGVAVSVGGFGGWLAD